MKRPDDYLLYDALSGGFRPPSDPEHRTHTLARLAYATIDKGEVVIGDDAIDFVYHPSWAQVAEVTASCAGDYDEGKATLCGLVVAVTRGPLLRVESAITIDNGIEVPAVALGRPGYENILPINLGPNINHAQRIIAQQAQNFFDRVDIFG